MWLLLSIENHKGHGVSYLKPIGQHMFLSLERTRRSKTAKVGTVVALVAGQKCWSISQCGSAYKVGSRIGFWKLFSCENMPGRIFKDIDVAKLLVEVGQSMQEQQGIPLAFCDANSILHERCSNPLMTVRWVRCHAIDASGAEPGRSQAHGAFKQSIAPNIRVT